MILMGFHASFHPYYSALSHQASLGIRIQEMFVLYIMATTIVIRAVQREKGRSVNIIRTPHFIIIIRDKINFTAKHLGVQKNKNVISEMLWIRN